MSTSVKHPRTFQRPLNPQPPDSAANHNSGRPNLLDQAELGRLFKPARSSISKESTTRSRRDNFSGSNLPFSGLQRSHHDYFSGSPFGQLNKKVSLTDPYRETRITGSARLGPAQAPPQAALLDVHLEIRAALQEATATCRIPCADRPPVVLDIPGSTLERPEPPPRRPESPRRGSRPPRRSHKRPGTALLLRHAAPGSDLPSLADGANDCTSLKQEKSGQTPLLRYSQSTNKGNPDCIPGFPHQWPTIKEVPATPSWLYLV